MNVFEIGARVKLDTTEYLKSLGNASKETSSFGSTMKNVLSDVAKASTVALGAAATGVSALVKESVSAYADYEQLVGGIQTLFEDLSWDVEQNANKAFKTAGLSVNEYLETAMSFSASLNQSLKRTDGNIARSADLTDMAILDMSDNANKMGTAMDSIQTAYAGFAKQNYTMLDNLKLGYGGTKSEMERLLADASAIAGVEYDISNYSDVIEAIHTIQQDLGITGTTAKEASETISGSLNSFKSAWKNLKTEIAKDDGDIETAFENLSETAGTVFDNVIPRVEKALGGVGDLIVKSAPKIGKSISKIIPKITPPLMEASVSIIGALGTGIIENIPTLLQTGGEVIGMLGDTIESNLPKLKDTAFTLISDFSGYLKDNLPALIPDGVNAVIEFAKGITDPSNTKTLIDTAFDVVDGLIEGFTSKETIDAIIEGAPVILDNLVDGLVKASDKLGDAAFKLSDKLIEYFKDEENREKMKDAADKILTSLLDGFTSLLGEGGEFVYKLGGLIANALGMGEYWEAGNDVLSKWWDGFKAKWDEFKKWWDEEIKLTLNPLDLSKQIGEKVIKEAYEAPPNKKYTIDNGKSHKRHAKGGVFNHPTYDRFGDLYGEAGTEVLLPLDNNTAWMDKFADKLENKMGGGARYTFNFYYQGGNGMSDAEIEEQAKRLAELSIAQIRAVGGTGF